MVNVRVWAHFGGMNIEAFARQFVSHNTECITAFHVVLVYEDYSAGRCAMDLCGHLLSGFDHEMAFQTSMWRFDALEEPITFEEAVCGAVQADAIILATYLHELPTVVRDW